MQSSAGGANQLQDQIREGREMCGSVKTAVSHSPSAVDQEIVCACLRVCVCVTFLP